MPNCLEWVNVRRLCIGLSICAALPDVTEVLANLRAIESKIIRGHGDDARLEYRDLVRNNGRDVMLRIYLAWCSMPSDESWNSLKGSATIYPENPWVHLGMGRIYAHWKMFAPAEASLQTALKADDRFYPALVGLGDLARISRNWASAEEKYRRALAIHDDAEARVGLGLALLAQDKEESGLKELRAGVELWPDQPEALAALADRSKRNREPKQAAFYLEKLLALRPRDKDGRRALADLHFEAGNWEAAAQEYERVIKGAPTLDVAKRLAQLYAELKRPEDEARALQILLPLQPENADIASRLSEIVEGRGALDEAEAFLREALSREPQRPDLLLRLARIQNKRGKFVGALESYREVQRLSGPTAGEAENEAHELARTLRLPSHPFHGTIESVNGNVAWTLHLFGRDRMKDRLDVDGAIKFRIKVNDEGQANVETVENSLDDGFLYAHTYFALKDAVYAKQRREAIVEFNVRSQKSK